MNSEADIASRLGRLNPVPRIGGATGSSKSVAAGGDRRPKQNQSQNQSKPSHSQPKRQPKSQPHIKTAEELDAEMDTYMGEVKKTQFIHANVDIATSRFLSGIHKDDRSFD